MRRLIFFVLGYKRLSAPVIYAAEIMNVCMLYG